MKKLITKFAVLALGLTVALAGCDKGDDSDGLLPLEGTYTGNISVIVVDDDMTLEYQSFTVATVAGTTTLSAAVSIPNPLGVGPASLTLPVAVKLTDITAYHDATLTIESTSMSCSGYAFNVAQQNLDLSQVVPGAGFTVEGVKLFKVNGTSYGGIRGTITENNNTSSGFSLTLSGTVTGFGPQGIPVTLMLDSSAD